MIVTLSVTVGKGHFLGDDTIQRQVELKTDSLEIADLSWNGLCAGIVQATIKEWQYQERRREIIDKLESFIDECCTKDEMADESRGSLYLAFCDWGGHLTPHEFYKAMHHAGFESRRVSEDYIFQGIRLALKEEQEAETK